MNPFAEITPERVLLENDYFLVIEDGYPVSPGHRLIISKASAETFFDLSTEEQESFIQLLPRVKSLIEESHNPDGYNIGMNCGEAAGQSVMHFQFLLLKKLGTINRLLAAYVRPMLSGRNRALDTRAIGVVPDTFAKTAAQLVFRASITSHCSVSLWISGAFQEGIRHSHFQKIYPDAEIPFQARIREITRNNNKIRTTTQYFHRPAF